MKKELGLGKKGGRYFATKTDGNRAEVSHYMQTLAEVGLHASEWRREAIWAGRFVEVKVEER